MNIMDYRKLLNNKDIYSPDIDMDMDMDMNIGMNIDMNMGIERTSIRNYINNKKSSQIEYEIILAEINKLTELLNISLIQSKKINIINEQDIENICSQLCKLTQYHNKIIYDWFDINFDKNLDEFKLSNSQFMKISDMFEKKSLVSFK